MCDIITLCLIIFQSTLVISFLTRIGLMKGRKHYGTIKILFLWRKRLVSLCSFCSFSGSCHGHPQSTEYTRLRSAEENAAAGPGSCLFQECWRGKESTSDAVWKWLSIRNSHSLLLSPQLVIVLKKEVIKTNNVSEHEDTDKYRQLLVRTLHSCSVRFPDMAANVIPVVCSSYHLTCKVL